MRFGKSFKEILSVFLSFLLFQPKLGQAFIVERFRRITKLFIDCSDDSSDLPSCTEEADKTGVVVASERKVFVDRSESTTYNSNCLKSNQILLFKVSVTNDKR